MSTELLKWLRANLGKGCTACCTGHDAKAIAAAVAIVNLYGYDIYRNAAAIKAFYTVVICMQHSSRFLAYHSIAMILDWPDRQRLWDAANLPVADFGRCKCEPTELTRVAH